MATASTTGTDRRDGLGPWATLAALVAVASLNLRGPAGGESGTLAAIGLLGLAAAAPAFGWLADRGPRRRLVAAGALAWGLGAAVEGLAPSFAALAAARLAIGVGAAAVGVAGATLAVDLFPRRVRVRTLATFALAVLLGTLAGGGTGRGEAAGGAALGALILAATAIRLREPARGASEPADPERIAAHGRTRPAPADYRDLLVNSSFNYSLMGLAFAALALGGPGWWLPEYLVHTRGLAPANAAGTLGLLGRVGGAIGLLGAAWVCDRLEPTRTQALFVVPGAAMLAAIPFALLAILAESPAAIAAGLFVVVLGMATIVGPCLAILAGVTAPNLRGLAYGATLTASALLGLLGPPAVGWVARTFAKADTMASTLGALLAALGAVPVRAEGRPAVNLSAGLLALVPAMLVSGLVLLSGARHLIREMALMLARLRSTPTGD